MSNYAWCLLDGLLSDGRFHVWLSRGETWFADDPVVVAYPQHFSATPLHVRSTAGRTAPGVAPVTPAASQPAPAAPIEAAQPTEPTPPVGPPAEAVRRGPGRPRKDIPRG